MIPQDLYVAPEGANHHPSISVIIPAYNEEKNIGNILSETTSIMDSLYVPYEIIVVNDGSTDKTGLIASAYKATVLSNGKNRGKGYSLRHALKFAHGDIIVTMDSDGEHKPKEIPDLLEPLYNGTDVVAGSRFLGQNAYVTTKLNQIGNFLFNVAIMSLTGKKVTDSQTGFRAMKRSVLDLLNLESNGYEIETEITVKSLRNGFVLQEKPVCVERRKHGQSKIKLLRDGKRIFKAILKASFARIRTSA
jgi:glycosyltransferase involved in cell wall biosynthesis